MSETNLNAHEEGFVRSFILKNKQERTAMQLASGKRRKEFLKSLAHFHDLDVRYASVVPPKVAHTVEGWVHFLKSKGAPQTCWVISEDLSRDGRQLPLEEALRENWRAGMGTMISCIPGKLGYFEDEDGQWLLER